MVELQLELTMTRGEVITQYPQGRQHGQRVTMHAITQTVFRTHGPPTASPAAHVVTDGSAMIADQLAAARTAHEIARLGRTSRCHSCRGGLRGPLGTRGMEARAYATQRLPPDHASG